MHHSKRFSAAPAYLSPAKGVFWMQRVREQREDDSARTVRREARRAQCVATNSSYGSTLEKHFPPNVFCPGHHASLPLHHVQPSPLLGLSLHRPDWTFPAMASSWPCIPQPAVRNGSEMGNAAWICASGSCGAGVVQWATRGAHWVKIYPSDFYPERDE